MGSIAVVTVAAAFLLGADAGTGGADGGTAPAPPTVDWEKALVGSWTCKGGRGGRPEGFFRASLTVTRALDGMYLAVEWKQEMVNGKPAPPFTQTVGYWWREPGGGWMRHDLDASRRLFKFTGTAEANLLVWTDPERARRDTLEMGPGGKLRGKYEGEITTGTWRQVGGFECHKREAPPAGVSR
jgi:hypothetical protein